MSKVYGIAETLFRDGYVCAVIFEADEEEVKSKPHYREGLATDYSFTTYTLSKSKEAAEKRLSRAKIALFSDKEVLTTYPAAGAAEAEFVRQLEIIEKEKGIKPDNITAEIIYSEKRK